MNWTIDAGATDLGWSVSGSPPTQSLVYTPTMLAGNTNTSAHVVSSTRGNSCGNYHNTASFTTGNDGAGSASASETVTVRQCQHLQDGRCGQRECRVTNRFYRDAEQ